jgi:predicted Kef-type K+ transport protein
MDWGNSRSNYGIPGLFVAFLVGIALGCAFGAFSLLKPHSDPGLFAAGDFRELDSSAVQELSARCVNPIVQCSLDQTMFAGPSS